MPDGAMVSPAVSIRYLDGPRLRRAVLAGIVRLQERREHLNNINVFPVPDGDTGTNMSLTMKSAAEGLSSRLHRSIGSVCDVMAESAILGSQGNSGAILAQFIRGLAEGLKGKARVTTAEFAQAIQAGKQAAQAALSKPKEGTILTVIRDWSESIIQRHAHCEDFVVLLKEALVKAKESLRETPRHLQVLKKYGVVDAGAQGFVNLLEGITEYVESGNLRAPEPMAEDEYMEPGDRFVFAHDPTDLAFRYCTECVIRSSGDLDPEQARVALEPLGDSLVVVGGGTLLKVHIHTNEPLRVYETAGSWGQIVKRKCDDMQAQHDAATRGDVRVAIVTDSSCDLPMEYIRRHFITLVPLKIIFGDEVFRDKMELSPGEFLRKCEISPHHPKTSQPSVKDFLRAYVSAAEHAKEILVVTLTGGASGTYQAALTAAGQFTECPVTVVDSRMAGVGQGLLVRAAQEMAERGESASSIASRLNELRRKARMFFCFKDLTFAQRGGRVGIGKSLLTRVLNLKPLLSFDEEGKLKALGVAFGHRRGQQRVLALAKGEWTPGKGAFFAVTHLGRPAVAERFVSRLRSLTGLDEIPIVEGTPVLGVHAGPGAVGIAVLPLD